MARQRTIKPEFWADDQLAELSRDARFLYIGLWNLADEHGRARGDARYVKGQIFPYDDDLTAAAVDCLLDELAKARKVQRYRTDGGSYLFLPNLGKHQRLEPDKTPSKLPEPPDANQSENFPDKSAPSAEELSLSYCSSLSFSSSSPGEIPGEPPATSAAQAPPKKTPARAERVPPNYRPPQSLLDWAAKEVPQVDPLAHVGAFIDYWTGRGDKGAAKKDWDATYRNWLRTEQEKAIRFGRASPTTAPSMTLFNPADHE